MPLSFISGKKRAYKPGVGLNHRSHVFPAGNVDFCPENDFSGNFAMLSPISDHESQSMMSPRT